MTLTILVSFSLLALVATARPAFPSDIQDPLERSTDVQNAVQAIFESRKGRLPKEDEEDVQIHITSSEEQRTYLSNLDDLDEIRAILPLGSGGVFTEEEKQLYNILSDAQKGGHLDDLDGGLQIPQDMTPRTRGALQLPAELDESLETNEGQVSPMISHLEDVFASPPLLVLAVSCVAALIAVLCVGIALYITSYLRSSLLSSDEAWNILPQLEKHGVVGGNDTASGCQSEAQYDEKARAVVARRLVTATEPSPNMTGDNIDEKRQEELLDLISFDEDELEEKFHDAEDHPFIFSKDESKLFQSHPDLPRVVVDFVDPELFPLPRSESPFYTPPRTPVHTPPRSPIKPALQMRAARPGSPVSIPAWSLRAADSPSFAVPDATSSPRMPGALFPDSLMAMESPDQRTSSRRVQQDPNSQIDIALALQLRPGLGLGADPAWLVRFLMTMFGWMTVLFSGRGA